jgi:hypothetical protein
MNFHIWKPEIDRWIVIRTEDGHLFDVQRGYDGRFTIGPSSEDDYKLVVNAVRLFEYQAHEAGDSILDFPAY